MKSRESSSAVRFTEPTLHEPLLHEQDVTTPRRRTLECGRLLPLFAPQSLLGALPPASASTLHHGSIGSKLPTPKAQASLRTPRQFDQKRETDTFNMNLRDRLHRWLHPRDPLLEAWRDDPFVEAMVARKRRVRWSGGWLRHDITQTFWFRWFLLFAVLSTSHRTLRALGFGGAMTVLLSSLLLGVFVALSGKLAGLFPPPEKAAITSIASLIKQQGAASALCDLWMAGIRGRDIVKVVYVGHRAESSPLPVFLFCIVAIGAFIAIGEPVGMHGIGGLVLYLLLLVWMRGVFHLARHGNSNPLSGAWALTGDPPPPFVRPVLVSSAGIDFRNATALILSTGLLVTASIAGMLTYRFCVHLGLPVTVGLFVQIIFLISSIILLLVASLERDPRLFEYIESQFTEVDRLFDLHVRHVVLSDADAGRVE